MPEPEDAFPLTDVERDVVVASVATGAAAAAAHRRLAGVPVDVDDRAATLLPGLYRHQVRLGNDDPTIVELASVYRRTAAENTLIVREALAPLARLAARSTTAVVLKGGAMVSDRYLSDIGGRLLSDVDVLLDPDGYDDVVRWFLASGWVVSDGTWHPATKHAVNLSRGRWGSLDLHAHLLSGDRSPGLDLRVRADAVTTRLLGQEILVPAPTHLLVHTVGHSSRSDLRFLVDAHHLITNHDIDWSSFVEHVEARRHVSVAARALGALSTIDRDLVPDEVMRTLRTADRHRVDRVRDPIDPSMSVRASAARFRASLGRKARHLGPLGTVRVATVVARQRVSKLVGRRRVSAHGR